MCPAVSKASKADQPCCFASPNSAAVHHLPAAIKAEKC